MAHNYLIAGMNEDLDECQVALEAGQIVWLPEMDRPYISCARPIRDIDGDAFQLVKRAGVPLPIAHLVFDNEAVPISTMPNIVANKHVDIDSIMRAIKANHHAWTTNRKVIDASSSYSWPIDYFD